MFMVLDLKAKVALVLTCILHQTMWIHERLAVLALDDLLKLFHLHPGVERLQHQLIFTADHWGFMRYSEHLGRRDRRIPRLDETV